MNNKIHHSFKFALEGILHAIRDNSNLQIHTIIGLTVFVASFYLGLSVIEKIIVMTMVMFVISAEMINTALEEMTNLITREHRVEAKISKDVSAGMVLLVSIFAAIVGIVIFYPYIF